MSENRGHGGGKGVTDTLVELDRGYRTTDHSTIGSKQYIGGDMNLKKYMG